MSFLNLESKTFLITGVANKKSVAFHVATTLIEEGARCIFSVQSQSHAETVSKLFPQQEIFICDVENTQSIQNLANQIEKKEIKLDGILHSIAFANFSEGPKSFHETKLEDFLQATNISCFSLVSMTNALLKQLTNDASIVTVSISNTRATSYGYLGPIKACLDSTVAFLAKSLSMNSQMRVNAVCAGPLKTSASSGIPNYIDNYLFAEQLVLRKSALKTEEVANTIVYLLSPRSTGINASNLVVDGGMSANYFDQKVVSLTAKNL
jgi:enoyl-[acyl-carrier protein] reductase I